MSQDKQKGKYVFVCDTCSEVLNTNTDDWDLANLKRKEASWRAYKDKETGDWKHECDACR
jgi:hypothetical protein